MFKKRARILSVILVVCFVFSLLSSSVSAARVPAGGGDNWVLSSTLNNKIRMSKSDAYTWIVGELTRISIEATAAIDSTAQPNAAKVLGLYGSYLAYMDWAVSNVSYNTSANQWTVFQGPADFDSATAAELIDSAESLRNRINEVGLLPDTSNIEDGTYNSTSATASALASSGELIGSSGDTIYGYDGYWNAMQSILTNYVDGHILTILAKHFDKQGSNKTALQNALSSDFPASWWTSTENGTPPAEMIAVINEIKTEVIPYLDVYNEIAAAYGTASYRTLIDETLNAGGQDYTVTAYTYLREHQGSFDSGVSYITRALYTYLYSAQTGESKDEETNFDDIDFSSGALKILANATINLDSDEERYSVKFEGDGEGELTTLGYYILAAGATYDPFVSIAGNETYIAVLDRFLSNNDQRDKVVRALQTAINTRKPVFVTEAGRSDWSTAEQVTEISSANYRPAYLIDLLSISENTAKAYAVVAGKMRPSSVDSSTWEYVQGGTADGEGGLITVGSDDMLASGEQMSLPIAYTCGSSSLITTGLTIQKSIVQTVGGLTSIIINNAALDNKGDEHIERAETEMLFLNGLGDIVLSDGTVILPAIANPILYDYSNTANETDATRGYYPYTATLLNHYPSMRVSADRFAYVSGENNVNKYIFAIDANNAMTGLRVYKVSGANQASLAYSDRIRYSALATSSFSVEADTTSIRSPFNYVYARPNNFRYIITSGLVTGVNQKYLVYTPQQTSDGISLFPLQYDNADMLDSYLSLAGPIVTSAVRYVSTVDSSAASVRTSSGKFRVTSYIEDFLAQGMLGNQYSETLVKNYQMDYESLVNDQYSRFTRLFRDLASDTVDTLGRLDGVLAVKDGYESRFFNIIVGFIQQAYLLIAVGLLIIIAVKFLRGKYSLIYVGFIGVLVFAAFQVYAVWMPTAIPAAYNFFVNDMIEDVVWNTVAVKSESYETTYKDSDRVDPQTGAPRPYTATITLYKMTQREIESVTERTNISVTDLKSGTPAFLDETAGIFVQGDSIKMSLDKLLANNAMRGLYRSQWEQVASGATEDIEPITVQGNNNPYIVKLTSPYVSLEAYYTPFCLFERSFLVNLNNFANIFRIERQTYRYDNYVYKDAFLFNAFTNSAIFTNPGDKTYESLKLNINDTSILGSSTATVDDIIALCEQHLSPFEDWLNLRSVFFEPSDSMKESLWGQMMLRQGYYSSDWTMTDEQKEKVAGLIDYINTQTKQFVIRNSDQLNSCSDENAIKLVSLYATTAFTHRVSEFGYWLYPNYINASDIELRDVLYGSMSTLQDRNTSAEVDVVNIVTLNLGVWGALLVLFITVFSAIFVFILTYLIPILYALFGLILVYKLVNSEAGTGVVKGYVKVTLLTIVLYICYSLGLKLIGMLGYQWYGYLGCLIITALCLYFLFYICVSVVTNPLELGNDTLARNLFGALDRLSGGRLNRLTSNQLHINSRNTFSNPLSRGVRSYTRGASVDDSYSGKVTRRGAHYGRWSDFDDDSLSMRARVISRFGQSAHLDDVGRTRTGFRHSRPLRTIRRVMDRVGSVTWTSSDGTGVRDRFSNFLHRR